MNQDLSYCRPKVQDPIKMLNTLFEEEKTQDVFLDAKIVLFFHGSYFSPLEQSKSCNSYIDSYDTFSNLQTALFWCESHSNWISGYRELANAKSNTKQNILNTVLPISQNQYFRHPTHSSWSCHMSNMSDLEPYINTHVISSIAWQKCARRIRPWWQEQLWVGVDINIIDNIYGLGKLQ